MYLDKQFVLQDGRPYGSFFLAKRSICCFIFGVYSACCIAEIWGRRRCWLASTLIRMYFLFSWDKAGREMMTDTSGLSVFSKYILAFWITSGSFHYLYRLVLQLICALVHSSTALIKTFWILFFVEKRVEFIQLLNTNRYAFKVTLKAFQFRLEKYPNSDDHWSGRICLFYSLQNIWISWLSVDMKINTNLFDSQKKRTFSPKSFVNSTTNTYIYLMSKWQNSQKYSLQIAKIQLWQQEARKKRTLIKHVPRMNVKLWWELTAQSHTISVHIQSRNILLEFFSF